MMDLDELLKKVDGKLDGLYKEIDLWEAIKTFVEDLRDNDEAKDTLDG